MNKLRYLWEKLHSSLWFIPALITLASIALAFGLIDLESSMGRGQLADRWPRLFGATANSSRELLSAIVSSMITVTGVTFSATVVALALASTQYTPRILRNFRRDRANQVVLGVFVGVFAYCLVVLRTINSSDGGMFVPALAVFVAVLLAFLAIGFLIFFIHHIAASIQASSIIESVTNETLVAVERLFPEDLGEAATEPEIDSPEIHLAAQTWITIPAWKSGYIQGVDVEVLLDIAWEQGTVVRMEKGVGEFVTEGAPLASVAGKPLIDEVSWDLNAAYTVDRHRTVFQDAAYGIRQIVDVALKALSPAINDTTTAITCVDFLGVILARLVVRQIETPYRSDGGRLCVIARGSTFPGLVAESFDQVRQNAAGNVAVLVRILQVLETLAGLTADRQRRQTLQQHADLIAETAERSVPAAYDRAIVQSARNRIFPMLGDEIERIKSQAGGNGA